MVGQRHAARGKAVEVWRLYARQTFGASVLPIEAGIAPSEIVREYEDDVGLA